MAVTKSWEAQETLAAQAPVHAARQPREKLRFPGLLWMLLASLLVASGLVLVDSAKLYRMHDPASAQPEPLNLNAVVSPQEILPYLQFFPETDRPRIADALFSELRRRGPIPNVGALAKGWTTAAGSSVRLSRMKPLFSVRTEAGFQHDFLQWSLIYLASFWIVFVTLRVARFDGDPAILPIIHLLTGIGLILMVSLRDPLRDTEEFAKFAKGVAMGCGFLLLLALPGLDYRRMSKWIYGPLLAAFALFAGLLKFGSGPGGSDARVNLGPFQPVEFIKLLLVLFLAGYFASKWERLRDLREKRIPGLRWINLPRIDHAAPVMVAVVIGLAMFFVLKDLGPALVTAFLFLVLFGLARGRFGLAVLGVVILVGGVIIGYHYKQPKTVVDRIDMWLGPWDNNVHGGNQLAHGLWALATGGMFGSGPGYGDPSMIPAGDTDLVLPSIGEEWGYLGVASIAVLFAFLASRGLRAALRARSDYGFFLASGLTILLMLEMLLISGGVLGAVPLSGVVSPFLSSGNSAMLANFLIAGLILAVSAGAANRGPIEKFVRPVRILQVVLGCCGAALLVKAAGYQVFNDRQVLARDTRVYEDDGIKRAQHNPRLNSLAHEIRRGDILDRNGLLLATSDWGAIEAHRGQFDKLNVPVDQNVARLDARYYPFGGDTVQVLGDLRTGENFHASNTSFIERDSNFKLQGYRDYEELAPLVRYRHAPGNSDLDALRRRDRNVHATLDARLQLAAGQILRKHLAKARLEKGSVVILDAESGAVLAMVNAPSPGFTAPARTVSHTGDELLDRARYGTYPPGSTFKIVTAMAALRLDPESSHQSYSCRRLPDGRVGAIIPGWNRPIHDDDKDLAHGSLTMKRAIVESCNGYFAQLGVYRVGSKALAETAKLLDISVGPEQHWHQFLPFASYGQGEVLVTPFKMARIAATVADGGKMPLGRWVEDGSDSRPAGERRVIDEESAAFLADAMRGVVTRGTASGAMRGLDIPVSGKTGTAQLDAGGPHAWFIGYAPASSAPVKKIAFAVLVEHGGYGGAVAAPIARDLVQAAEEIGIIAALPSGTNE